MVDPDRVTRLGAGRVAGKGRAGVEEDKVVRGGGVFEFEEDEGLVGGCVSRGASAFGLSVCRFVGGNFASRKTTQTIWMTSCASFHV